MSIGPSAIGVTEYKPPAFPSQVWLHSPDVLRSFRCGTIVPMIGVRNPPLSRMLKRYIKCVFAPQLCKFFLNELEHKFINFIWLHIRNGPDRKLADDFSRDDSLCSWSRECPLDAVDRERGVPPPARTPSAWKWYFIRPSNRRITSPLRSAPRYQKWWSYCPSSRISFPSYS
jgi:hypothetical protein